ncbi:MAG: type II toxin-antitoxin system PemK/MazF family toxin [Cyanobacteria bacterium J06638_38]
MVLSPLTYNRISHFVLACPITNSIKRWKFEVILSQSMQTSRVVLADQLRVLDWRSQQVKFVEKAIAEVIEEALAKASVLFN